VLQAVNFAGNLAKFFGPSLSIPEEYMNRIRRSLDNIQVKKTKEEFYCVDDDMAQEQVRLQCATNPGCQFMRLRMKECRIWERGAA
jgi:hypothetical protein